MKYQTLRIKVSKNKMVPQNIVVKQKTVERFFVERETLCDKIFVFHAVNGWEGQSNAGVWLEITLYMFPLKKDCIGHKY